MRSQRPTTHGRLTRWLTALLNAKYGALLGAPLAAALLTMLNSGQKAECSRQQGTHTNAIAHASTGSIAVLAAIIRPPLSTVVSNKDRGSIQVVVHFLATDAQSVLVLRSRTQKVANRASQILRQVADTAQDRLAACAR